MAWFLLGHERLVQSELDAMVKESGARGRVRALDLQGRVGAASGEDTGPTRDKSGLGADSGQDGGVT